MSFFPRLDLPVQSTCYHGGRVHENGYGYVDDSVIDRMLKEEEDRLNQYLETLRYKSAPLPLGWNHRSVRNNAISLERPIHDGNMRTNETYADGIDEDFEEDEEELVDTQDDEIVLDDEDDDEMEEDMDMDDDDADLPPTPPPVDQPHRHHGTSDQSAGYVHGPIQTVNLTSFLESPIDAPPIIRPPQRYSVGSYDAEGSSTRQRRRFSLPRPDFSSAFDDSRRSSIMSTGSSVDHNRQTPTRRFSFSSPSTIRTPSTSANPADVQDSTDESAALPSDASANPLAWGSLRLR